VILRAGVDHPLLGSPLVPTIDRVEARVKTYLDVWNPAADPLITREGGIQVKSSNVNGVEIDGERYYYRVVSGFNADPVSRGETRDYRVVSVLDAGTDFETEIYELVQ
jgi:hypothetical protein